VDITGFTGTAPAYEVWVDATPILIIVPKKTLYGGGSIAPATDLIVYRRESGGQLTLPPDVYRGYPGPTEYKLTGNVGPFTTAHNGDQTITVTDGIAQQLGHRLVSPGHYSPAHRRLGVLTLRLRPLRGAQSGSGPCHRLDILKIPLDKINNSYYY
jgi:hypothetical protein